MHFVFAMLVGHHSFVPISIHFPPHSSSEIKQQRVLHPISQQHKTFSPSIPLCTQSCSCLRCCELVRVALTLSCLALHRTSSIVHGCNVDLPILHFSWVENLGWLLLSCSCSCWCCWWCWVPNTVILCNLCSPGGNIQRGPFVQSHAQPSQVTIEHRTGIDQQQHQT